MSSIRSNAVRQVLALLSSLLLLECICVTHVDAFVGPHVVSPLHQARPSSSSQLHNFFEDLFGQTQTQEKPKTEAPSSDLSIPYDAAARLAYDEWRSQYSKGEFDPARYENFKANYNTITVANVVAKKKEREGGESSPEMLTLNEFADCSEEEYMNMQKGAQKESAPTTTGDILSTALEAAESQKAASSALSDAADALAEEETKLAKQLGLESVEELEEALDMLDGVAPDGGELESNTDISREARIRSAYMEWCNSYNKEPDESRFRTFSKNFLTMEQYSKEEGKKMQLNKFADCTEAEYATLREKAKAAPVDDAIAKEKAEAEAAAKAEAAKAEAAKTAAAEAAKAEAAKAEAEAAAKVAEQKKKVDEAQAKAKKLKEEAAALSTEKQTKDSSPEEQVEALSLEEQAIASAKAEADRDLEFARRRKAREAEKKKKKTGVQSKSPSFFSFSKPPATKKVQSKPFAPPSFFSSSKAPATKKAKPLPATRRAPQRAPARKVPTPVKKKVKAPTSAQKKAPQSAPAFSFFNKKTTVKKVAKAPAPVAKKVPKRKPREIAKKEPAPFSFFGSSKPSAKKPVPTPRRAPVQKKALPKKLAQKKPDATKKKQSFSFFGASSKPKAAPAQKKSVVKRVPKTSGTLSLFGPGAKKEAPKDNIPVISRWKQNPDGSITGNISNSKNFRNGQKITTSPVRKGAKAGLVRTGSGSQYRLL